MRSKRFVSVNLDGREVRHIVLHYPLTVVKNNWNSNTIDTPLSILIPKVSETEILHLAPYDQLPV